MNKLAKQIASDVLAAMDRKGRVANVKRGEEYDLTNLVEATVQEHLSAQFRQMCPLGAILFNVAEEDGSFRINVIAGDRVIGGNLVVTVEGEPQSLAMAISEMASEFDCCYTPGQALHAWADGLDATLAQEAWQDRAGPGPRED